MISFQKIRWCFNNNIIKALCMAQNGAYRKTNAKYLCDSNFENAFFERAIWSVFLKYTF